MSRWSEKDLEYIAKLARLKVRDEEVQARLDEFKEILDHIETLNQLDTQNVKATTSLSFGKEEGTPLAEDQPRDCLDRDRGLSNAPDRQDAYFRVPRFIEEGKGS